ncbi:hypothetical protein T484DRAFT_1893822 [Baffinella frigidus]|nr:hypothetical protein T484DRAFT_1893822 [Cryptophyta sp. CCMP2293]
MAMWFKAKGVPTEHPHMLERAGSSPRASPLGGIKASSRMLLPKEHPNMLERTSASPRASPLGGIKASSRMLLPDPLGDATAGDSSPVGLKKAMKVKGVVMPEQLNMPENVGPRASSSPTLGSSTMGTMKDMMLGRRSFSVVDLVAVQYEKKPERRKPSEETAIRLAENVLDNLKTNLLKAAKKNDHTEECAVCRSIADTFSRIDENEHARVWLLRARDVAVEHNLPPSVLIGALRSLVKLHQKTGDHGEAIKRGLVLLETAEHAFDPHYKGEACHLLAISYEAQGDRGRALAMDAAHLKFSLHEAQWEVATSTGSPGASGPDSVVRGDVWMDWKDLGVEGAHEKVISEVRSTASWAGSRRNSSASLPPFSPLPSPHPALLPASSSGGASPGTPSRLWLKRRGNMPPVWGEGLTPTGVPRSQETAPP